jgi:hypothetical protein
MSHCEEAPKPEYGRKTFGAASDHGGPLLHLDGGSWGGMTALETAGLRRLAVRVLMHQAGPDADAAALAAAAGRAYHALAGVLAPLIGQVGIDALAGRAVHLAQREYPWLATPREPEQEAGPFTQVNSSLEQQDPALATEAAAAVLAIFTGLLATFIGEPLTMRVMRKAWPDGFSEAGAEETRA